MNEKVILAYSGGLDTSVILKWLIEEKNYDVISVCVDVGQREDFLNVQNKALKTGAIKSYVIDVKEEFAEEYIFKGVKAGAIYEDDYLLGTAYARPLISKVLVEIAKKEDAMFIAHGATGKGNDQVRFEASIKALSPEIKVIAPWRQWSLNSRESLIEYAKEHGIEVDATKENIYSRDENLFHISHEGGNLEDPWNEHKENIYKWCVPSVKGKDKIEKVIISFKKGIPTAINYKNFSPVQIIETLNKIGSIHGIGVIDIIENRLIGMKSRGVYETPGGTIIFEAHKALEKLVLDRNTISFKKTISNKYSELLYDGLWFTPLKKSLDSFIEATQDNVTGDIVLSLYKGSVKSIASRSPYSLYSKEYVTFGEDKVFNQFDAEGFINIFTIPLKLQAEIDMQEVNKKNDVAI
ncbi:MAG: argininosuccinate synthase [Alkaliphilus sp.]|nr:argininosuccinate synthase [Alkaliphilus sp. AH-315-G20]MBN4067620.1 argininosuccinate synthase [Alkaliphilus transvaalensis]PHS34921.1 MAG: argininosuccinate synthase [Alkaliphilus sp.]